MNPNIRTVTLEDAESVQRIYAPSITKSAISFELEVPSVDDIKRRIKSVLPQFPWIVYEEDKKVVGYAYGGVHRTRAAYQWMTEVSVYVDEKYFARGIGKFLYEELFKILKKQGYHRAVAGITLPNPASIGIHKHFGFEHVGTFKESGYKLGSWHDVDWWSLELNPAVKDPSPPIPFLNL
jgi:L-amino acid N-acyltransferase YncA